MGDANVPLSIENREKMDTVWGEMMAMGADRRNGRPAGDDGRSASGGIRIAADEGGYPMHVGLIGCDGETRRNLVGLLRRYGCDASTDVHIDFFEDAAALGDACAEGRHRYQLAVLDCDAEFAGGGIAEAERLRAEGATCPLVLVASDDRCAVEGYRVGAVGYLIKPVGYEDLSEAIARIALLRETGGPMVVLTAGARKMPIDVSQLMCCQSSGHYVVLHRWGRPPLRVRASFHDLEQVLEPFPQIERSTRGYLVNFDYVAAVDGFDFVLIDGTRVPIGQRNASRVKAAYHDYVGARCA